MCSQGGVFCIKPPLSNRTNFFFWKVRIKAFLQALGADVWAIVEGGYQYPASIPIDIARKKQYETNAKVVNAILGSLAEYGFVKFMQLNTAKAMWDNLIQSYEGDAKVKSVKLQTLRIQYETLRRHNDESIASFFLHIDEIVNCMKNLGEEIRDTTLVEKILIYLTAKFDSKVSTIGEKWDI